MCIINPTLKQISISDKVGSTDKVCCSLVLLPRTLMGDFLDRSQVGYPCIQVTNPNFVIVNGKQLEK